MTDKEIVERAKKAEKRTCFGELVRSPISKGVNSAFGIGFIEGMVEYRNSLQEEPVREDLEEVVEEIVEPTILNAYGTKELARRLRNTICGTCVSEELEDAAFDYAEACKYEGGEKLLCVEHFKAGAKWQFNQLEKNRLKHCNSITNEQAELEQGFIDQHLDKHQRMPTFLDAIEYGMKKMKEQMMANAVERKVLVNPCGIPCIDATELYDYDDDKVKVIVIKED